jgi:hypothetical protein
LRRLEGALGIDAFDLVADKRDGLVQHLGRTGLEVTVGGGRVTGTLFMPRAPSLSGAIVNANGWIPA